ncbi:hypothetical protein BD779DRAFT_1150810 [Infundibulicybe gibba]|nr:hypothetical protein BD779DRAFT_1150810 [Infundibulicybe gibba]
MVHWLGFTTPLHPTATRSFLLPPRLNPCNILFSWGYDTFSLALPSWPWSTSSLCPHGSFQNQSRRNTPSIPSSPSGVSQTPPSQENTTDNHGKTPTPPATTRPRASRNRARQGKALEPQAECDFCHKAMAANQRSRHEKHCELNPDRVEAICPECHAEFSRSDSVKRHLDSPTACPGPQSATPTLAPSSSPLWVAQKNHHGSPSTPSPISVFSQSSQPSRIHYTNNHYALYMARQLGLSPPVPSNFPSMNQQYAFNQSNPAIQDGSNRFSPSQDARIPPNTSDHQYQASASVTPRIVLATSAETTWQAELVNERKTHHWCDGSPAEYMGSRAAASALGNREEYFPLKYGFGSHTQYQAAVPHPVQGFRSSPSAQPASHLGPSRPQRAMLEELNSPCIGEDIFPGGEPAIAGYANHSQSMFSLPAFQATPGPHS